MTLTGNFSSKFRISSTAVLLWAIHSHSTLASYIIYGLLFHTSNTFPQTEATIRGIHHFQEIGYSCNCNHNDILSLAMIFQCSYIGTCDM